jgi:ABC-type sugar transport system substrate-binding protein
MICSRCGHLNNPANRFCESCGSPLETPTAPPQTKTNVPAIILGIICALLTSIVVLQFLGVIHPIHTALLSRPVGSELPKDAVTDYMPTVSLLIADDTAFWYVPHADDIAAAVDDAGFALTVSSAGRDAETQMMQLEDAIAGGADVVVLEPVLAEACIPALQVARESGVAVVLLGSGDGLDGLYDDTIETGPFADRKLGDWLHDYIQTGE